MLSFPALPDVLLLSLACLLTVLLALWAVATVGSHEDSAQAVPAASPGLRVLAGSNREGVLRGRAYARLTPPRVRPGGRGAPHARRRSRRVRSG